MKLNFFSYIVDQQLEKADEVLSGNKKMVDKIYAFIF